MSVGGEVVIIFNVVFESLIALFIYASLFLHIYLAYVNFRGNEIGYALLSVLLVIWIASLEFFIIKEVIRKYREKYGNKEL